MLEWGAGVAPRREAHLADDVLDDVPSEVFITSSTRDVHPVVRIDDRELVAGPVTARVAEVFAARAAESTDP